MTTDWGAVQYSMEYFQAKCDEDKGHFVIQHQGQNCCQDPPTQTKRKTWGLAQNYL